MDPIKLEKLEAMDNYKSSCFKNHPKINNAFFVYILTALICSLVFFSPFWYPSFESLFITLPNLISNLVTPKCLFIVGNLIVFVLVGESKLLNSKPSQQLATEKEFYHEYLSRSQTPKQRRTSAFDHTCVAVHSECKKLSEVTRPSSSCNGRLRLVRKVELIKEEKGMYCSTNKGSVVRSLSSEELSKRADDFIARVNRQRRLEAYSSC